MIYDEFELRAVALADVCPADLDDSGAVDFSDLLAVLTNFGNPGATDLDGSGTTGFADLLIVLTGWGPCPPVGG